MSSHYGYEDRCTKTMRLDFWLTIGRETGGQRHPRVKVSAGYPALSRTERAMNLKISLPLALFEQPSLTASIKVDSPQQAIEINADTIAEAVQTALGMDVDVQVVRPAE